MTIVKKTTLCIALLVSGAAVHAQNTTYDWTGTGGFTAMLTLDSPSSSGGSLSDIVSIYVLDPASDGGPYGPYANYPVTINVVGYGPLTLGAEEFDSGNAFLTGPFTWNSSEITSMSLQWFGLITLDAGTTDGNSITYDNGDAGVYAYDNSGIWQADGGSVPDAGSTSLLLGVALTGLGLFRSKRAK